MIYERLRAICRGERIPVKFTNLRKHSIGFYWIWVAHIGRQTGLLQRLARGPISLNGLANATKMHPPAVRAWSSAAVAYGLVHKAAGKMYIKPEMKAILLDKRNPDYLGGQFSYLALRSLEYGSFEDLFRFGKTRQMSSTISAIEQATDWDHYAFLAAVRDTRRLHRLLSKGCSLLDVGCGTGSLLEKVHHEYPKSNLVGIDPSERAVSKARSIVKGKPIKISRQAGESMKFDNKFDIVYLGESLYAAKDKRHVVSNCHRALKDKGTIAIVEGLLPESGVRTEDHMLIMGMQLDFALQGHKFMTRKEVTKLLISFSGVCFKYLGGSVYLITGKK